jgi:PPE-repeat protein
MYSGPGTGPMLAAAAAWDQLASDLNSSAAAYRSVVAGLTTDGWRGPSSMMMADAVVPYVAWIHGTAAQAEQTAVQAKTAAAAYQTAFAMTVPPPLIEANRTQLASLIASNFFGQNSPAIAATEADYERMWAQDTAAMHGYAASSSTASKLAPFTDPPQLVSQSPTAAIQQLATPAAQAVDPGTVVSALLGIPSATSAAASISSSTFSGISIPTTNHALAVNAMRDEAQGIGPFLAGSIGPVAPAGSTSVGGPVVSAVTGRASVVGALSVPQSWAATVTPAASPAGATATGAMASAAPPPTSAALPPGMFGETMLGTLAGRGVSNAAAKLRRPSVIPRSPAAG